MEDKAPNKVALILRKEWREIRQQRGLLLGMVLPPLLFVVLPIGVAFGTAQIDLSGDRDTAELIANLSKVNPVYAGMSGREAAQALISQQMSILFFLLPLILPSIIASYSVVGEKASRTLEPILATPVRTWELLLAKCLSAVIPSLVATWVAAGLFICGLAAVAVSSRVFAAVVSPGWIIVLLLCTPLLALITVAATVAISSRVNDPRTAQQISAVLILPIMLVFFGQMTGLLVLNPFVALAGAALLALIAAFTVWLAVRLFQREVILTRWT
jgi:ABC-2 type transport system permease protein